MKQEQEIWKDVEGYEGRYQVSNLGRVRSKARGRWRLLAPTPNRKGYMTTRLFMRRKNKSVLVHRLVAYAFVDGYAEGLFVNHKDENPANNRAENLEWVTTAENNAYGSRTERVSSTTGTPIYKVDDDGVVVCAYRSVKSASEATGLHHGTIERCLNGITEKAGGYRWAYAEKAIKAPKKAVRSKVQSLKGEVWRDIAGFEGLYQVSNLGRVKSLRSNRNREIILKKIAASTGYYIVNLYKDGKCTSQAIHRLVAMAFIEGYRPGLVVNHIDENPKNNDVSNLEWVTQRQNALHGTALQRRVGGESMPVLQMTPDGKVVKEYKSAAEAMRQTGIPTANISHVCHGRRKFAGGYIWKFKTKTKQ